MKIISLTLRGYKRLSLNAINYIKLVPQEKLQLILGTNGSGKSSLMQELSPLPANSQDFHKTGLKEIVIDHGNSHYVLTSVFLPTQRHSFTKNEEELNPGGTASVQKELVKREFNITPDIHELMIGRTAFCDMGPAERRQWFTRLSDTNYNYAISVYQKLKEKLRDAAGAIKRNQSRAVTEANKLLSPEQEAGLREEILEYRRVLDELLILKSPKPVFLGDVQQAASATERELRVLAQQLLRVRTNFLNLEGFTSLEAISQATIEAQAQVHQFSYTIDVVAREIDTHQQMVNALSKSNLSSLNDIDGKVVLIRAEMAKVTAQCKTSLVFENPSLAFQAIHTLHDNLTDILTNLEPNAEKLYSRERYQSLSQMREQLLQKQRATESRQLKLGITKKALEEERDQKPLECPKCAYTWHKGYTPEYYQTVCDELVFLGNAYIADKEALAKQDEALEKLQQYITMYRAYTDIARSWPILAPLWNHLVSSNLIFEDPRLAIYFVEQVKADLLLAIRREALAEELADLAKLKAMTEQNEANHVEKLQETITQLSNTLFEHTQQQQRATYRVKQLKAYRETALLVQSLETQLSDLLQVQHTQGDTRVEALKQSAVNQLIRHVQLELSQKEQQLSQVTVQKSIVENIQLQLKELDAEEAVLKIMVKELSPTDGLIAKGMLGFINSFVVQMNRFIRKVWLYPLELVPCLPDEEEEIDLDYKFEVRVNDNPENTIKDIKLASKAMSEIINLAFKLVTANYLGLTHGTFFADELGSSMDSAHRASIFAAITGLLAQSDFEQLFIISHFEGYYGSFKGADIAVLCSKNIVLPKDAIYNAHVVIE